MNPGTELKAAMAAGFGIEVRSYDPFLGPPPPAGVILVDDLDAALRTADLVSLHVPSMDRPVQGPDQIARPKSSAIVVNRPRGDGIDEATLASALSEDRLQGVGLDVYSSEPPESDNPIFRRTEAVLTPHSANRTVECAERMAMVSAKNIIDFFHSRLDPALVVNGQAIGFGDGSQPVTPGTAAMSEAGNEPS